MKKQARVYFYKRENGKKVDLGNIVLEYEGDMSFEELRKEVIESRYFPFDYDGMDIVKSNFKNK